MELLDLFVDAAEGKTVWQGDEIFTISLAAMPFENRKKNLTLENFRMLDSGFYNRNHKFVKVNLSKIARFVIRAGILI